jgi:hypothetical protein
MAKLRKPRIFIGSSEESYNVVRALAVNLGKEFEVVAWTQIFRLGQSFIDDLLETTGNVDFATFIFSGDDLIALKKEKLDCRVVRDNVVFEMGLFVGSIGKSRCFIVKPKDKNIIFPTDIVGITYTDYDEERSDENLVSALLASSDKIHNIKNNLGLLEHIHVKKETNQNSIVNYRDYPLKPYDIEILCVCISNNYPSKLGLTMKEIHNKLNGHINETTSLISIEKLCRSGLIDKSISMREARNFNDTYEEEVYVFSTTESGISAVIKNEDMVI